MSVALVIAAGGTGGHLIPALAVADAVRALRPDARIGFVGTARGMERDVVPPAGYDLALTSIRPFSRSLAGVAAAASVLPATLQARRILRRVRARAVLGMGGYPSVPVVLAARLARIPLLVHEQNAVPGLANEIAARLTPYVGVSFPQTSLPHARLVGVPVRGRIDGADLRARRGEGLDAFGLSADRRTVLAFGGSLGAARLNAAVVALAERWAGRADRQILLATGRAHHAGVVASLPAEAPLRCVAYLERMDLAYAAADVVVARAGASTVHELALAGLPAVLAPFPHARRREQHENARLLVEAGAATLLEDASLDGERLAAALEPILDDDDRRRTMGQAARRVARPDAARAMAAWLLSLAEGGHG